jgi:hypothetical protein
MAHLAGVDAWPQDRRDGATEGRSLSRADPAASEMPVKGETCVAFQAFHHEVCRHLPGRRRLPFCLYRGRRRTAPRSGADPPARPANVHDGIRAGLRRAQRTIKNIPECLRGTGGRVPRGSSRGMPLTGRKPTLKRPAFVRMRAFSFVPARLIWRAAGKASFTTFA